MTTPKRRCKNCEYYAKPSTYGLPYCQFNPPIVSGDHQAGSFPHTNDELFCSKWEPKWDDNPTIAEAWELFQTTLKLAK